MDERPESPPDANGAPADGVARTAPAGGRPSWRRRAWRVFRGTVLVAAAVVVGVLVAVLSIDWGPTLRGRAEREGSRLIERPLHIGRLSTNLLRGRFVLEDVRIEGLDAGDAPFLDARRIVVDMPWWTVISGEIYLQSITMSDWRMRVETFPDGRHSFIKIPTPRRDPDRPRRFVTTVQLVRAERGEFTYEDHGTPWSTVARNLDITVAKLADYRGEFRFHDGTITIQTYEPMWANAYATFRIDGGDVILDRIDLDTDGAASKVTGVVHIGRWPEQTYEVASRVNLARQKDIWWAGQDFTLSGEADFRGTFKLFKGGRELAGTFTSEETGLNDYRFPGLHGKVRWLPHSLEVTEGASAFFGGRLGITYTMAPLGDPKRPAVATLDTTYEALDLRALTDFMALPGMRLLGQASGRNVLRWPLGRWGDRSGEGRLRASPPAGVTLMSRRPVDELAADYDARGLEVGPFDPQPLAHPLAVGGEIAYVLGPEVISLAPSWAATPLTYVAFEGTTRYGQGSRIPFHVTSGDWQESDRVLTGIIMAVTGSSRAVPIGGVGTFDGVMLGAFNDPRVEGRFSGQRMRAWDVTWGTGTADVVVEDSYALVENAVITKGDARMDVSGKFSLGYPRRDGGEELDTRVRMSRWDLVDLRHAFVLDDYPVDGEVSGDFHIYDRYEGPQGFGRLTIERGVAYGERFERGTAGLAFDGAGVHLDGLEIRKSTGTVTGAAYIAWEGTYSFNADGRAIPMESVDAAAYPQAPISGSLFFTASGAGTFAAPRYEVKGRIEDLYVDDEGVGDVTGALSVRDQTLTIDVLEAASPRLAISGWGRIALTPESDAELRFRVTDTSLDPYVRALQPGLSPYTTAVVSGTLRVSGELRNPEQLRAEASVDQVDLRLFDYRLRNDGPLLLVLDRNVARLDRMRLIGEGTQLELIGEVNLTDQRISLRGLGDANLGILQGVMRDVRSSGAAEVQADVRGTLANPIINGAATLVNGRIRHFALPHALESLNGRVEFDRGGMRIDGLTGTLGGGEVRVDGRVGFKGFAPSEFSVTATGTGMRLRYPEGFRSVVDADLSLRGDVAAPVLGGTVTVRSAVYERGFDPGAGNLFGGGTTTEVATRPATATAATPSGIPVRFDVRILAPGTLRFENRVARLQSTAELTLRGTYDRPQLFGRVEVTRGEVFFEGNRYQVTRGVVDFANAQKIEPFFDVEAETRVRVPGQIYRVVFHVTGVPDRFVFDLTSDPPLAPVDILGLLLGDTRDPQNAELRELRTPGRSEQELIAAGATRLLASPISSEVGRVVEQTLGVDTVQISPSLGDVSALQSARLNPSARFTIGKRLSERLYLTYSRALSTSSRDQIILVEYTQSDRLAWIISQNEDRTYAVDVRVRHVF